AVHEHFRLHDRHDVVFLGQRRIAGQRVRIGLNAEGAGDAIGDVDDRTPFREARTEGTVLDEPLPQAVEAFVDGLARKAGERLRPRVDLDARNDPVLGQVLGERHAVARLLPEGLVVKDDAADRLFRSGGGEQHFTVAAAVLLGGFQPYRVEALANGA